MEKNDVQYNIIREQGEFFDPKPLNQQDNRTVIESETPQQDNKTTPINE